MLFISYYGMQREQAYRDDLSKKKKKLLVPRKKDGFKPRKKVKEQETGDLVKTLFSMIRIVK